MPEDVNHSILLRKILVAVDPSFHSQAALEAAAVLASMLKADIHGLFVQEEHWNRVSRLPFATAISELTGKAQSLQQEMMEQQIQNLQYRLRRKLEQISRQNKISHTWKTVRGKADTEILKAAREADLITIGRRGGSFPATKRLGSTARSIIQKADKPILVLAKNVHLGKRISILYDATLQSQKGLRLALALAEKNDSELSVLISQHDQDSTNERDADVEEMVDGAAVPVRITTLGQTDIYSLLSLFKQRRPGLIIMPKGHSFLQGKALDTIFTRINSPLLLMS